MSYIVITRILKQKLSHHWTVARDYTAFLRDTEAQKDLGRYGTAAQYAGKMYWPIYTF